MASQWPVSKVSHPHFGDGKKAVRQPQLHPPESPRMKVAVVLFLGRPAAGLFPHSLCSVAYQVPGAWSSAVGEDGARTLSVMLIKHHDFRRCHCSGEGLAQPIRFTGELSGLPPGHPARTQAPGFSTHAPCISPHQCQHELSGE